MQNAHLAIASVPVQSWGEVYDQNSDSIKIVQSKDAMYT